MPLTTPIPQFLAAATLAATFSTAAQASLPPATDAPPTSYSLNRDNVASCDGQAGYVHQDLASIMSKRLIFIDCATGHHIRASCQAVENAYYQANSIVAYNPGNWKARSDLSEFQRGLQARCW